MVLAKLQENFAKHLYEKNNLEIVGAIDLKKIPAEKRLNIYRNNVFGSFCDVLELTYKITKQIVGDNYFKHLMNQYNQKYTSPSGNLEDYGEYFWQLIESLEVQHKLGYLKDIAKLEWFNNLSYLSREVRNINIKKLQSLSVDDFEELHFDLHPSCYLLSSKYPLYSIWFMNHNNTDQEINLEEKGEEFILIQRFGYGVDIHQLSRVEFDFLSMIIDKKSIHQIYEKLASNYTNEEFDVGLFVNKFISSKTITNFKVKNVQN